MERWWLGGTQSLLVHEDFPGSFGVWGFGTLLGPEKTLGECFFWPLLAWAV